MRLSCVGFDCSASVIVVGQFLVGAMLSMRIETSIIARAMAFIATGMLYFMLTNFHFATSSAELGVKANHFWGMSIPGIDLVTRSGESFPTVFNTSIDEGARFLAPENLHFSGTFDTLGHLGVTTNHFWAITTGELDMVTRLGDAFPTFYDSSFVKGARFLAPQFAQNFSRYGADMGQHLDGWHHLSPQRRLVGTTPASVDMGSLHSSALETDIGVACSVVLLGKHERVRRPPTFGWPTLKCGWQSLGFWAFFLFFGRPGVGFLRRTIRLWAGRLLFSLLWITLRWELQAEAARVPLCQPCGAPRRASFGVCHGRRRLSWLLCLYFLPCAAAVCQICGGFFSGCTGGEDGTTCTGPAAVQANAAALVAGSTAALSLIGMFRPAVTRVFNSTVLGLLKTYAAMPVAGTPFSFADKSGSDLVEAVISGKVSKKEVQVHLTRQIEGVRELDADARTAQLAIIEAQMNLLKTVDEGPATSASAVPLAGVYHFIWAKCSEVVLSKDTSCSSGRTRIVPPPRGRFSHRHRRLSFLRS